MNVLITGVGRGIGRALAKKFLSTNYDVTGTYLNSKPDFASPHLTLHSLDLSNDESVNACTVKIAKSGKKFDILINNAGALFDEDDTKVDINKLRKTLDVNLIGTINFTESVINHIVDGGHVVNISSRAGSHELEEQVSSHNPYHYPAYRISKAALNMYTVTLAQAMQGRNIVVSSIHPGWVKTDMGGQEADITPEQAAEEIYKFAIAHPESGHFWYKGEWLPW